MVRRSNVKLAGEGRLDLKGSAHSYGGHVFEERCGLTGTVRSSKQISLPLNSDAPSQAFSLQSQPYSALSDSTGSTPAARNAGRKLASMAAAIKPRDTPA